MAAAGDAEGISGTPGAGATRPHLRGGLTKSRLINRLQFLRQQTDVQKLPICIFAALFSGPSGRTEFRPQGNYPPSFRGLAPACNRPSFSRLNGATTKVKERACPQHYH